MQISARCSVLPRWIDTVCVHVSKNVSVNIERWNCNWLYSLDYNPDNTRMGKRGIKVVVTVPATGRRAMGTYTHTHLHSVDLVSIEGTLVHLIYLARLALFLSIKGHLVKLTMQICRSILPAQHVCALYVASCSSRGMSTMAEEIPHVLCEGRRTS